MEKGKSEKAESNLDESLGYDDDDFDEDVDNEIDIKSKQLQITPPIVAPLVQTELFKAPITTIKENAV